MAGADHRFPAAIVDAAWREQQLTYQVTADGTALWPPRLAAPGTGAQLEWRDSAGLGVVYAATALHSREGDPRSIVLVELDEGFRMMSRVEGVAADAVLIGMRVRVRFTEPDDEGARLPVFEPEERAGVTGGASVSGDSAARGAAGVSGTAGVAPGRGAVNLRASSAIVGAAESDLGAAPPGTRPVDLMAQASLRALADAGLTPADVDGLFAATTQLPMAPLNLAQDLGIEPRYTDATNVGGSSFMFHVAHARAAIAAGLCEVALVAYGSTQRLVGRGSASVQELDPWEEPFRPLLPLTAYALAASRHMHEHGTTREQLAAVAVSARRWAALNPKAWSREPLTVEDVLGSRMVADPLTVRDCCLVTDGGGAIVLTSAERARDLPRPPVYVLGCGEAHSHRHITGMPDLTRTAAVQSGAAAFEEAGVAPDEVKCAQLYDAFTITPILFLEDLGFCARGEAGPLVASGATDPGGALPMNTSGGGLSYCHPGMYGLLAIVEAVRQVRGECGERQVPSCEVALAHGNGGVLSSQATLVLGSAATA